MTTSNKIENKKISATRLLLFVIIAFVVSNIFRFDIFHIRKILENSSNWSFIITNGILEGSGIFIAGLLGIFPVFSVATP